MRRRLVDMENDYKVLLAMQRLSWRINFQGRGFNELAFRSALRAGVRRDLVYVYESEDDIVGWLWLDLGPHAAHIRHIQVSDAYWGQGYGRLILEDAVSLSQAAGCSALTLNVTKSNQRAMRLYEHRGFCKVEDTGDRQRMRLTWSGETVTAER